MATTDERVGYLEQQVSAVVAKVDIKGALQNIQGLTIASMVGIAAIAVGVLGFLWLTARNMNSQPPPPAQYQSTLPAR